MFCIINYNIFKGTHGASWYNWCLQIKSINHAASLPIGLIQLWRIDKNMKLIWLKDVKELTAECHKQWTVTAWRKINGRGWSPSRALLGSVALMWERAVFWPVWSKEKLDRFNGGQKGNWQMKYRHCGGCLTLLSGVWNSFLICCWLSISLLHIYMQHSCSGSPGARRPVVLPLKSLYGHIAIMFGVQFNILERCNLPHKSYEPRSNRREKCLRKNYSILICGIQRKKNNWQNDSQVAKSWKSPLLCWDCSCKLSTICYFPL